MIELKLKNKKGKLKVKSSEIKEILRLRPDFDYVQDISDSINQENIMVFDCKLADEVFNLVDIEELEEELDTELDESYFDVLFEDVRAYLKDALDEIEAELQELYLFDELRCSFDIYNINEEFTDFKFVFLVSFKPTKISSLINLAKIVSKRQLGGASKFYS